MCVCIYMCLCVHINVWWYVINKYIYTQIVINLILNEWPFYSKKNSCFKVFLRHSFRLQSLKFLLTKSLYFNLSGMGNFYKLSQLVLKWFVCLLSYFLYPLRISVDVSESEGEIPRHLLLHTIRLHWECNQLMRDGKLLSPGRHKVGAGGGEKIKLKE